MNIAQQVTHIVPIGCGPDNLIASIRQHVVHKVIAVMVAGDENHAGIKRALMKVQDAFGSVSVEKKVIEMEDVWDGTLTLLGIMEAEATIGNRLKINISGGMGLVSIAAYIAGLVSRVDVYIDIPIPDNPTPHKIKRVLEPPHFPIKVLSHHQLIILEKIGEGISSLEDLIVSINPGVTKGLKKYENERTRISHHLRRLKTDQFIEMKKVKKTTTIKRTKLGTVYLRGYKLSYLMRKRKER